MKNKKNNKVKWVVALILAAPSIAFTQPDKYTPCLNYFSVGETTCQPIAATPVNQPTAQPTAQAQPTNPVDQYLANYGKPPREFVEFYLNPTPENALKWTQTYNNLMLRSQALSRSWAQAEQVYNRALQSGQITTSTAVSGLPPVTDLGIPLATDAQPQATPQQPQPTAQAAPQPRSQPLTIGAFNPAASGPTRLTYYFSANCPFCARLTPQLQALKQEMGDNLAITCVDVTPLSPTHRPSPENMQGKLNCSWRAAPEAEIQSANVRQTPTLLVQKPGQTEPTRIAGYLPPDQLRTYLQSPQPSGRIF
ncbi:MAG: hypothetical protein EBQ80_03540 [Proteobacteria bacterium]|nr:hypothetical protein [Pseudomonadota bacterium]